MVVKCFCERAAFPIGTRAPSELKAGLGIHVSYAYHSHVKASPERDEPSRHSKRGRYERWWDPCSDSGECAFFQLFMLPGS